MKGLLRRLHVKLVPGAYYGQLGEPVKCTTCGSVDLCDTVTEYMEYRPMEKYRWCAACGEKDLGYWCTGYWNTGYRSGEHWITGSPHSWSWVFKRGFYK